MSSAQVSVETDGDDVRTRVTVRLADDLQDGIEGLADLGVYKCGSAVLRDGVRRVLRDPSPVDETVRPLRRERGDCRGPTDRRTVRLTEWQVLRLEDLVDDDHYPDRTEAVRHGVHRVLAQYGDLLEADVDE